MDWHRQLRRFRTDPVVRANAIACELQQLARTRELEARTVSTYAIANTQYERVMSVMLTDEPISPIHPLSVPSSPLRDVAMQINQRLEGAYKIARFTRRVIDKMARVNRAYENSYQRLENALDTVRDSAITVEHVIPARTRLRRRIYTGISQDEYRKALLVLVISGRRVPKHMSEI
jgi:hypothetical protein